MKSVEMEFIIIFIAALTKLHYAKKLCVYQITNNIILWNVMRVCNVSITNTWANLLHGLNNCFILFYIFN